MSQGCEQCSWMPGTIEILELTVDGLNYELQMRDLRIKEQDKRIAQLQQQVEELKKQALHHSQVDQPKAPLRPPSFIKANVARRRRKKPGRKKGHEPALRPMPKIDSHQDVPLQRNAKGHPICPACRCRLAKLRRHKRVVEDLIRSAVQSTCYHTHSGHCPNCDKRVESRAPQQPPPSNLPHGQLGLHALTTAAILRIRHRLPFRQIAQLLMDLPGLRISAGAIVKQIQRLARWLEGKYRELIRHLRASEHVNGDETAWRIDGRNFWLWAFTNPTFTLYHVDESRGGKVPLKLLGKSFDGTLTSDFYSAYDKLPGKKQRCLTHLMREVRELSEAEQSFADCPLSRKLMRWCREALRLKKQWDQLNRSEYEMKASRLEDRLQQLAIEPWEHPDAARLAKRLRRYRAQLTRFLWDPKLEGTNNAAERALRPAVVMRKITGGSRSNEAAIAWAKLASLLRTADQRQLGVYEATKKLVLDYWATSGR